MKIYLGADHRGFKLKAEIKPWLEKNGHEIVDVGATMLDPHDDYPLIAEKLGKAVANTSGSKGILLCGSGVGASAAVNKIDGVRAAIGISETEVKAGRNDDDMNVLVLAADETLFKLAKKLITVFIRTPFGRTARYSRRLNQIQRIEKEN